jgi:hypothetical protein
MGLSSFFYAFSFFPFIVFPSFSDSEKFFSFPYEREFFIFAGKTIVNVCLVITVGS